MKTLVILARLACRLSTAVLRIACPPATLSVFGFRFGYGFVFLAALLALGGCRSHKAVVRSDSVHVQQVQHSYTLQQYRDSPAASDSLCIDMQGVRIFVLPASDSCGEYVGGDVLTDSSSLGGMAGGVITGMMRRIAGGMPKGNGLVFSADRISVSDGKNSVSVKDSRYERNDSSARDSSRVKVKSKVMDKPSSGWRPMVWILGIFVLVIVTEFIRNRLKR